MIVSKYTTPADCPRAFPRSGFRHPRMAPPPPSSSSSSRRLLAASLTSASTLVLLQLLSRSFSFILNQALLRIADPSVFGTAAIQFDLLLSTILFLSREGVRNALLRSPSSASTHASEDNDRDKDAPQLTTNISLLPLLLGIPVALLSAFTYLALSSPATASQPHFRLSVYIYALAAILELLAEPLYIRAQNALRVDVRARAEGAAAAAKTAVTFAVLAYAPREWALAAFAAGQMAYGLATLGVFGYAYRGSVRELWPRAVSVSIHEKYVCPLTRFFRTYSTY